MNHPDTWLHLMQQRPNEAVRRLKEALAQAPRGPDRVECRLSLAMAYRHARRPDDSLAQLHAAIKESEALDDRALRVRSHAHLSSLYGRLCNWRLAMLHAGRAVELGEQSPKIYTGPARINLAMCLARTHDIQRAVETYRVAAKEGAEWGSPEYQALALNNLGNNLNNLNRYEEAIEPLRAAAKLLPSLGPPHAQELCLLVHANLTVTFANLRRFDEARLSLSAAERACADPGTEPVVLHCRAHLMRAEGQLEGALEAFQRCIAVASREEHPWEVRDTLTLASDLSAQLGRWEQAWRYEREAAELGRSLHDERRIFALEELKKRHELEVDHIRNTELAAANAALQRANEELKRTAERLQAAGEAKTRFLTIVSHELRTPLTGILGIAELLMQRGIADANDDLHTLLSSARIMAALLNDLLDTFKLEAGRLELDPVPFRLSAATHTTLALITRRAEQKGIKLHAVMRAGCPDHVIGDDLRYQRILMNLLSNAIKFTASGMISLHIAPHAAGIYVEIADEGIGISEEVQATLFQPFRQAAAGTTRTFGGTGLGLSITKQLVELFGGRIGVRSAEGEGATFWFELPLTADPDHPALVDDLDLLAQAPPRASLPPVNTPAIDGLDVLVIDDDTIARRVTERLLRALGAAPRSARDGAAGIAAATAAPPEVIFLDWMMPDLDGPEVARRLRAQGITAPIFALTAHASSEASAACAAAGMQGLIAKPASLKRLREALVQWLPAESHTA